MSSLSSGAHCAAPRRPLPWWACPQGSRNPVDELSRPRNGAWHHFLAARRRGRPPPGTPAHCLLRRCTRRAFGCASTQPASSRRYSKWRRRSPPEDVRALEQVPEPFAVAVEELLARKHPPARPACEARQPDADRQVEPHDRVGVLDDERTELVAVAAVDHPTRLRQRRGDARAQLLRRCLGPVRAVMELVELDVRHAEALGERMRPTVVFPDPETPSTFTRRTTVDL